MSEKVDFTFVVNDRKFYVVRERDGPYDVETVYIRLPKKLALKMARMILKEYV
ncbi:MAG: hypothetical protein L3K18_09665 [Thermoplasmata archaeon]|nr:hypothetical protein [Thermoplasmata archaeon]